MSPRSRNTYSPRRLRLVLFLLTVVTLPLVVGSAVLIYYYMRYSVVVERRLQGERWMIPSRIYARPLLLHDGQKLSARELVRLLNTLSYEEKDDGAPASITCLKTHDATPHWHQRTHEYYYVLEGTGRIVIDGESVPVEPGDCVWIRPGAFHYAEGDLTSLIIGIPPFDPEDVLFDPPSETRRA